jgi:hypothetical protein
MGLLCLGNDEDATGDDARQTNSCRANLHDARLACLADPHETAFGQADRAEQRSVFGGEVRCVDPCACASPKL